MIGCWHTWSAWVDIAEAEGSRLIQERRCSKCSKVKRRATSWLGELTDDIDESSLP